MEVLGMIMLRVTEPNLAKIRVSMDNREDRPVQFQVRKCTVDKKMLAAKLFMDRVVVCMCILIIDDLYPRCVCIVF